MQFQVSEFEDRVHVLFEESELLDSRNNYDFSDCIKSEKNLELDFCHVNIIDSLFIGKMIMLYKKMKNNGQELLFSNLNPLLKDLFASLRLLPIDYDWKDKI